MSVSAIAGASLVQAVRRFDASAQRVARASVPGAEVDLAAEAVEQVSSSHAVSANLAALRTADETLRQLLDIKV